MSDEVVSIFLSYSRKDGDMLSRLNTHLAGLIRTQKIKTWHDRDIEAGSEWEPAIQDQLNTADIVILLISADFMASEYCYGNELRRAIERHNAGEAIVIPIILKPCLWNLPEIPFSKLNVLPDDAHPITKWADPEEALANVANHIAKRVERLKAQKAEQRRAKAGTDEQQRAEEVRKKAAERQRELEKQQKLEPQEQEHLKQQGAAKQRQAEEQKRQQKKNGPIQGDDLRLDLKLSFKEAVLGGAKEIRISRLEICTACKGSGARICLTCKGTGEIRQIRSSSWFFPEVHPCSTCNGIGQMIEDQCYACGGLGQKQATKHLLIPFPAGVNTGTRLRISKEGDAGRNGGSAGDLFVYLLVDEDEELKRNNQDILSTLEINKSQAAAGCKMNICTIDGFANLRIPPNTKNGATLRLKNRGVPRLENPSRRGHHFVTILVKQMPE